MIPMTQFCDSHDSMKQSSKFLLELKEQIVCHGRLLSIYSSPALYFLIHSSLFFTKNSEVEVQIHLLTQLLLWYICMFIDYSSVQLCFWRESYLKPVAPNLLAPWCRVSLWGGSFPGLPHGIGSCVRSGAPSSMSCSIWPHSSTT